MGVDQLGMLMTMVVPLGAFTMIYFLNKQETEVKKKMVENGMNPKDSKDRRVGSGGLKFGGVLVGAGLGLFLAAVLDNVTSINDDALYFGLITLFAGLGLILGHNFARKQEKEDEIERFKRENQ